MATITHRKVKAARAVVPWTQKDLAKAANLSVSTIADFERGAREPKPETLDAIEKAFWPRVLFVEGGIIYAENNNLRAVRREGYP